MDPTTETNPNTNTMENPMISTFMEITSATLQEAQFYLESHNFDLDSAVSTFFESSSSLPTDHHNPPLSPAEEEEEEAAASLSPSPSPSRSRSHSPPPAGSSQYNLRSRAERSDRTTRGAGTRGGVRTLADLSGDGDDSDDGPPEYFTGGQKSGMVVQDPSKDSSVDSLFEQARRMGAMEGPADVIPPSSSSRSFSGTARLLFGDSISSSPQEVPPATVTRTITIWRNGFTVDDGPLRMFTDPANASFLASVANGDCPKELEPADRRIKVQVNLTRKDHENCPEPVKRKTPFQGVGRTLGSSSSSSDPSEPSAAAVLNTAPSPVMGLVVDDNSPSTSIQLRLADGTRMVSRFNYHNTIRDIHAFIDASRPGRRGTYTLQMMGFPPKQLTDLDQTIEQAGLANSVVMQKF